MIVEAKQGKKENEKGTPWDESKIEIADGSCKAVEDLRLEHEVSERFIQKSNEKEKLRSGEKSINKIDQVTRSH